MVVDNERAPPSSAEGAQCKQGKACGRRHAEVHAGERGAHGILATIPCHPGVWVGRWVALCEKARSARSDLGDLLEERGTWIRGLLQNPVEGKSAPPCWHSVLVEGKSAPLFCATS